MGRKREIYEAAHVSIVTFPFPFVPACVIVVQGYVDSGKTAGSAGLQQNFPCEHNAWAASNTQQSSAATRGDTWRTPGLSIASGMSMGWL